MLTDRRSVVTCCIFFRFKRANLRPEESRFDRAADNDEIRLLRQHRKNLSEVAAENDDLAAKWLVGRVAQVAQSAVDSSNGPAIDHDSLIPDDQLGCTQLLSLATARLLRHVAVALRVKIACRNGWCAFK